MSLRALLDTSLSPDEEDGIHVKGPVAIATLVSDHSILNDAEEALLNRFAVRVSALIQSKKQPSRWFGNLLVFAAAQSQCWKVIKSHGATWAPILLNRLKDKNSAIVQQSGIQALTALIQVTAGKPNLTRDITTPNLHQFVTMIVSPSNEDPDYWLECVRALNILLAYHPASLRSFQSRIYELIHRIYASWESRDKVVSDSLALEAAKCYASVYLASPKDNNSIEWERRFEKVLSEVTELFAMVVQPHVDEQVYMKSVPTPGAAPGPVPDDEVSIMRRLTWLVMVLRAFLSNPTPYRIEIPVGSFIKVIDAILSARFYSFKRSTDNNTRAQVTTFINDATTEIASLLLVAIPTLSQAMAQYFDMMMHHLKTYLSHGNPPKRLKLALLRVAAALFPLVSIVPKSYMDDVSIMVDTALDMVKVIRPKNAIVPDMISAPDAFVQKPDSHTQSVVDTLLVEVVKRAPELPHRTRAQIDRYFIVSGSANATISALYPGKLKYSIAPMAARLDASTLNSVFIHPRFPPLAEGVQNLPMQVRVSQEEEEDVRDDQEEQTNITVEEKVQETKEESILQPSRGLKHVQEAKPAPEPIADTEPSAPPQGRAVTVPEPDPAQKRPNPFQEEPPAQRLRSSEPMTDEPISPQESGEPMEDDSDEEIPIIAVDSDSE
uniref:Pre-rRNA-processing protein RIX1 n=1 Tax=Blastobotrys adeninivorans TaxID=409370 RepID=A0A060THJ4_BLAAD